MLQRPVKASALAGQKLTINDGFGTLQTFGVPPIEIYFFYFTLIRAVQKIYFLASRIYIFYWFHRMQGNRLAW